MINFEVRDCGKIFSCLLFSSRYLLDIYRILLAKAGDFPESAAVSSVSRPSDTNKYFISVRGWLLPNLGQLVLGNEVELSWVRLLVHGHSEASASLRGGMKLG